MYMYSRNKIYSEYSINYSRFFIVPLRVQKPTFAWSPQGFQYFHWLYLDV